MADLQVNSLWLMNDSSRALDFSKFVKSMTQLETISRCDNGCHVFLASHPTCCHSFRCLLFHSISEMLCHPTLLVLPLRRLVSSHFLTVSMSFHGISLCFVSTCHISLHFVLCYLGLPFLCWYYSQIHSLLSPLLVTRQIQLC